MAKMDPSDVKEMKQMGKKKFIAHEKADIKMAAKKAPKKAAKKAKKGK